MVKYDQKLVSWNSYNTDFERSLFSRYKVTLKSTIKKKFTVNCILVEKTDCILYIIL